MSNKNGVQTRQSIDLIIGLDKVLGRGNLFAYLVNMTIRIAEIYRVLKPTGSFFLHCDPTASHYLKIICDTIFTASGGDYRNDITWKRTSSHSDSKRFARVSDNILYFTKSDKYVWNQEYLEYSEEYQKRFRFQDVDGRRWTDGDITAKGLSGGGYTYEYKGAKSLWRCPIETMERLDSEGRLHFTKTGGIRLKKYLDETSATVVSSVWDDIFPINSQAAERLGYPTQKPLALMERIIKVASNECDLVLDAYCGCGTTTAAAQNLNRRWIGIDITYQSISLVIVDK